VLIHVIGRPGHAATDAYLQAEFDATFATAKNQDKVREVLTVMVHLQHPKAVDALIASREKAFEQANIHAGWYALLIPQLPRSAIPQLEAITPKLSGRTADLWVRMIQQLREKE
jgi:hypothetical protein